MRQVLAIFRKDVRQQKARLAGALALTVLVGWADRVELGGGALADLLHLLWIGCWASIGASVLQQERATGDRQYWLTRPYDWQRLLAAKALFVLVFAALPLFAMKAAVLWSYGISPLRHAAVFFGPLAFVGAAGLLAGALAAVTASVTQFLWGLLGLAVLTAGAIAFGQDYGGDWGVVAWVRSAGVEIWIGAAGAVVLVTQYRRRNTLASRAVLSATALIAVAAPIGNAWHGAWRLGSRLSSAVPPESVEVGISPDPGPRPRMRFGEARMVAGYGHRGIYLPVVVTGLPDDGGIVSQRVAVTIQGAGGRQWASGWGPNGAVIDANPMTDARFVRANGSAWQYLDVDREFYEAVKDAPVRIEVSVALVLLDGSRTGTMRGFGQTAGLPLDGICHAMPLPDAPYRLRAARGVRNVAVSCVWPRPGPGRAYVRTAPPFAPQESHALLSGSRAGAFSIGQSIWRGEGTVVGIRGDRPEFTIETWRAAAHLERSYQVSGVRLRDYAAPRITDPQ